jgi:hypothetical protein
MKTVFVFAAVLLICLAACEVDTPSLDTIKDSKLFDRRIKETPRQQTIRECQLECGRFRVDCKCCHTTNKVEAIESPAKLALTPVGERARIMRKSPAFGLNQDCSACHLSKFTLNRAAEKIFSPGGAKYQESQKELKPDS